MGDTVGVGSTAYSGVRGSAPAIADPLRLRIGAWLARDPDPVTRAELRDLLAAVDDPDPAVGDTARAELVDRFAGPLSFGTAGVRAPRGAGPRRMNRLVVEHIAAGLCRWLATGRAPGPSPFDPSTVSGLTSGSVPATDRSVTVVIGWDRRHRAEEFALDLARVVAGGGGRALLLPAAGPTPLLAFAVRHLGADAGIMCTASHNPPAYSGCKIFLGDGAQIAAPHDAELAAAIAAVAEAGAPVPLSAPDDAGIVRLGPEVTDAYVRRVLDTRGPHPAADLRIVYTPLHGVAGGLATSLLARAGHGSVTVVAEQAAPDPDFPTTPYPDPEEVAAYDLALTRARVERADLVLLHDPDGDRLGLAVPSTPGWRILTGNEIGALLCEHVLAATDGPGGSDRLVVTTVTSSRLLAAIARDHGVHHVEVPMGFKWVVRPALAHPEWRFVFGFEESLGFSVDAGVRDKDGLAAAVAAADLVADLRAAGRSVGDELERLSRRHGHHASLTWSARLDGLGAADRQRAVMDRWRARAPAELAGRAVVACDDLAAGVAGLPPTDAIVLSGADGSRVVVRPSGTEPKIKVHLEVVEAVGPGPEGFAAARRAGTRSLAELRAAVADQLDLSGRD